MLQTNLCTYSLVLLHNSMFIYYANVDDANCQNLLCMMLTDLFLSIVYSEKMPADHSRVNNRIFLRKSKTV